ncbi:MAG: YciI-like protein [Bacteroidota bacterium]
MKYYALIYDLVDDYIIRRTEFRTEHLRLAKEARERKELMLAGAFSDPADQALLVFRAADASVAENFAKHDPYVLNGLVKKWRVREWTVVVGNE